MAEAFLCLLEPQRPAGPRLLPTPAHADHRGGPAHPALNHVARRPSLRPLTIEDFDPVRRLWEASEGVGLSESDSCEANTRYLVRNPGLSQVALTPAGEIIGAVLCGHDGRRGYLHHLAVSRAHRGQGLGRKLVQECLRRLRTEGITKCNIFLFATNHAGRAFLIHGSGGAR